MIDAPITNLGIIDTDGQLLAMFSLTAPTLRVFREWTQEPAGGPEQVYAALSALLEPAIQQAFPFHLRPPSDAQIAYALGIARALGIAVPPDVLVMRGVMHDFLDQYVPEYNARRKRNTARQSRSEVADEADAADSAFGSFE